MPLWFDNTGCHCVSRVLEGSAGSYLEIDGFLQFASLLALSDAVLVNGGEAEEIRARTNEVAERVTSIGLEPGALALHAVDEAAFDDAVAHASLLASGAAANLFRLSSDSDAATQPDLTESHRRVALALKNAIFGEVDDTSLAQIVADRTIHHTIMGATRMVLRSTELRVDLRKMFDDAPVWTDATTLRLDSFLRIFLNDALARAAGAVYAPSVGRARTIERERRSVHAEVSHALDEVVAARDVSVALPALTSYLLLRGRGEPEGILAEAVNLREKTGQLRAWMKRLTSSMATAPVERYLDVCAEVEDLGSALARRLRLRVERKMGPELTAFGAIPLNSIISGWRHWRRIAALTDIAKTVIYAGTADAEYQRLVRGALGATAPRKETVSVRSRTQSKEFDVFISHASEDKESFVRELARSLRDSGVRVWFDEFELVWGQSLSEQIDRGLSRSRYGLVVLSHNFFSKKKKWTKRELGGLFATMNDRAQHILPIWHELGEADIVRYSPLLSDLLAVRSSEGVEAIVAKVVALCRSKNLRKILK